MANIFNDFSPFAIAPQGARVNVLNGSRMVSLGDATGDPATIAARSFWTVPTAVLAGVGAAHVASMRSWSPQMANATGVATGALLWYFLTKGS